MTQILITPPAELAVDLVTAKANLHIDGDDMDPLVTSWIKGVTSTMEGEIGQCMVTQEWDVIVDRFADCIALPHPANDVVSVSYIDQAGVKQDLAPALCRIVRKRYESTLVPARGARWPVTACGDAEVTIRVSCGYGPDDATTPAALKLYIISKLVEQYDPVSATMRDVTTDTAQSKYLEKMLDQFRSYT
jgi:uncharacterized phiE125 gp8 family phage protein